jgi:hypothetical protein
MGEFPIAETPVGVSGEGASDASECPPSLVKRTWPKRLGGRPLVLSVLGGREVRSGNLAHLKPGQAWEGRVRVGSLGGAAPAAELYFEPGASHQWVLMFRLDPDFHGAAEALGYEPDRWERLKIGICGKGLWARMAQLPEMRVPVRIPAEGADFAVGAQDLEVSVGPEHAP